MKKIFSLTSCFIFCLLLAVQAQEGNTKIRIKVKDANGKLIEKEYDSEDAFRNDPELKDLGIEIDTEGGEVMVRSQGDGNRTVIVQQGGSEGGNAFSQRWKDRGEVDSLRMGSRAEMFHLKGSIRAAHRQYREEHREEMNLRREEMRARREALRQQMQELDVEREEGPRIMIIQKRNKEETRQK